MLYESPGGNEVDGLPPVAHNATGVKEPGLRPKLSIARGVFNRDVLANLLSEFHKIAMGHSRYAKVFFTRSS